MATQLEIIAEKQRQEHLARNVYIDKNGYSTTHENALSTGDEKGKGETDKIGSSTDIQTRISNIVKNTYSNQNGYGVNNPNALSDGDEKGKGETITIGSHTDINTRTELLSKNI